MLGISLFPTRYRLCLLYLTGHVNLDTNFGTSFQCLSIPYFSSSWITVAYMKVTSLVNCPAFDWQVRLEGRATIRNGIVCLNPKVVTLLGGVVQSLYEEWQMNKKYSGFSRSSLRVSQESDGNGPPPFEKLQVGVPKSQFPQQDKSSCQYS